MAIRKARASTSTAASPMTEPAIVAGITSSEGQPVVPAPDAAGVPGVDSRLALVGAAVVLGLVAGVGLSRLR